MTSGHKGSILVVDDEPTIAEVVGRYLERAGYSIRAAGDGREALELARAEPPDLVVLDLMLPGVGGLELLRRLRERERVPVVILTAKDHPSERVTGLQLGADDYVVKPFSNAEVEARIASVLRRTRPATSIPPLSFDGLVLNLANREVRIDGELVVLTAKEFDLLAFLASSPRQVFSREQLLDRVWNSSSAWQSIDTVTEHVRRLRKRIEANPNKPRWLTTVWGVGYRFNP